MVDICIDNQENFLQAESLLPGGLFVICLFLFVGLLLDFVSMIHSSSLICCVLVAVLMF
jgi:hypothetical protein